MALYSAIAARISSSCGLGVLEEVLEDDEGELLEEEDGLLEEARQVYPFRHLNSLNTVGYKEMFKYLDGEWTLEFAIGKIKQNSRIYSRKQMTWFKRDKDIVWFHPDQQTEIMQYIHSVNH